jgi:hypothetical protein
MEGTPTGPDCVGYRPDDEEAHKEGERRQKHPFPPAAAGIFPQISGVVEPGLDWLRSESAWVPISSENRDMWGRLSQSERERTGNRSPALESQ